MHIGLSRLGEKNDLTVMLSSAASTSAWSRCFRLQRRHEDRCTRARRRWLPGSTVSPLRRGPLRKRRYASAAQHSTRAAGKQRSISGPFTKGLRSIHTSTARQASKTPLRTAPQLHSKNAPVTNPRTPTGWSISFLTVALPTRPIPLNTKPGQLRSGGARSERTGENHPPTPAADCQGCAPATRLELTMTPAK